jgi:hypothetical protein
LIVVEILYGYDSGIMQSYIKVNDKEQVDKLLAIISDILTKKQLKVFNQYRENIKSLEN